MAADLGRNRRAGKGNFLGSILCLLCCRMDSRQHDFCTLPPKAVRHEHEFVVRSAEKGYIGLPTLLSLVSELEVFGPRYMPG